MKSTKDFRPSSEDTIKKATKLEPIRKSGKERHTLFKALDQDDDEDAELNALRKRESALDYLDDGSEDEDEFDSEEFDDDYDDDEFDDQEFDEPEDEETKLPQ